MGFNSQLKTLCKNKKLSRWRTQQLIKLHTKFWWTCWTKTQKLKKTKKNVRQLLEIAVTENLSIYSNHWTEYLESGILGNLQNGGILAQFNGGFSAEPSHPFFNRWGGSGGGSSLSPIVPASHSAEILPEFISAEIPVEFQPKFYFSKYTDSSWLGCCD